VAHQNGFGPRHRVDDAEARKEFAKHVPSSRTWNPEQYAVTDGWITIGTIELIDGRHVAVDASGQTLGTFATLRAAVASFGSPQ
jgi:hypothetical protein